MEDDVTFLLADPGTPAPTVAGVGLDGDSVSGGVVCTDFLGRSVPASIPLGVTRTATPSQVVKGTLCWHIQAIGTWQGCAADMEMARVDFTLQFHDASTPAMTDADVLVRDVPPSALEIDTNPGVAADSVVQPFNYYAPPNNPVGGRGQVSPLSINLPIYAVDYGNTVGQATASSEFNVHLRSSPQIGGKARLD